MYVRLQINSLSLLILTNTGMCLKAVAELINTKFMKMQNLPISSFLM